MTRLFDARRLTFKNLAATTLAAPITDSQTSITVTDGSQFPQPAATGLPQPYHLSAVTLRLRDDSTGAYEILLMTGRSGNTLTVERGAEGTTRAAWGSGLEIANVITMALWRRLQLWPLYFTSQQYAYEFEDGMQGFGDMLRAPHIPLLEAVAAMAVPTGTWTLRSPLRTYTFYAAEAMQNIGTEPIGTWTLRSPLRTYTFYADEAIQAAPVTLIGTWTLRVALVSYLNYRPEAIQPAAAPIGTWSLT